MQLIANKNMQGITMSGIYNVENNFFMRNIIDKAYRIYDNENYIIYVTKTDIENGDWSIV